MITFKKSINVELAIESLELAISQLQSNLDFEFSMKDFKKAKQYQLSIEIIEERIAELSNKTENDIKDAIRSVIDEKINTMKAENDNLKELRLKSQWENKGL